MFLQFQEKYNLSVNGIADGETWGLLTKFIPVREKPVNSFIDENRKIITTSTNKNKNFEVEKNQPYYFLNFLPDEKVPIQMAFFNSVTDSIIPIQNISLHWSVVIISIIFIFIYVQSRENNGFMSGLISSGSFFLLVLCTNDFIHESSLWQHYYGGLFLLVYSCIIYPFLPRPYNIKTINLSVVR